MKLELMSTSITQKKRKTAFFCIQIKISFRLFRKKFSQYKKIIWFLRVKREKKEKVLKFSLRCGIIVPFAKQKSRSRMHDKLAQILSGIRAKTGVEVRIVPAGKEETAFTVTCFGKEMQVYVDGGEKETEQLRALVCYLVEKESAPEFSGKAETLKSILLGEGGDSSGFRFMTKYLVPKAPCFALDVVPEKKLKEAAAHIGQCIDGSDMVAVMDETRIAVVRFSDTGQTPYEFGQFLSQSLYEEMGVRASVGVGSEISSFSEIAASYYQAATANRMSALFQEKGEVHSYREYLLVRMIEDVPKHKLSEYLKQFRIGNAAEVFKDAELSGTAEEFLKNNLNVSETARCLFVHRNTLNYRLDKIERTTGLDIRKFTDAVTFRVVSILYRLLQS